MLTCRYHLKPDQTVVGDPIDVVTGASLDTQTDFALAGPLPIRWHRNYDSGKGTMPGSLGWGQFHEFDRRLVFDLDGMRYVGPTGDVVGFPYLDRDGQTAAAAGVTVRRVTARQFTVVTPGEPLATFDLAGGRALAPLSAVSRGSARVAFGYDKDGLLHSLTDSKGRTLRAENDGFGRLAKLTLLEGARSRRLAEYQYDTAGNLVRVTDPYGNVFQSRFDRDHRQTLRIDRRGYAFQFDYDAAGRCVRAGGHDGTDEVRLRYDLDLRMTVVTKRDGGDWTYFYDDTGVVTRVLAPDGGIVQYNRDETGRLAEEVDPLGNKTRRLFSAAGAITGKLDPLGLYRDTDDTSTGPPPHRVPANPAEWDCGDWFIGVVAETPAREADDFGLLFRESFADGTHRRWVYDANGNVTKAVDREGRATGYEYVSWNMLAAETDPLGGQVRYRYAPHRHITAVVDAGNTLSEYGYDANERLEEVRRHGIVKETYRHDVAGNLIEKRDADGKVMLRFDYGPANLPVVRRLASGDVHEFKYDAQGRYLAMKGKAGAVAFAYDIFDRRVKDERDGRGVEHEYGMFGLLESVILDKFPVKYERRTADELAITDPTGGMHTLRFFGSGATERHYANGTAEVSKYGEGGRCLERVRTGVGGEWSRRFRYSPEGDLLAVTDSVGGETTYRHDAAHRVTGVQRPGAAFEPIDLDPAGNILRMPGLSGVRMLDGNRLSEANGERFEYDRRNHIAVRFTGTRETRYHYDSRDFLVKVERTGEPDWTAAYDPLGRRAWKQWGDGKRVEYFWDTDRLIAERDESGRLRVYVYADPFAMVPVLFVEYASADADPADGQRYYVFTDQIGCPTRVEDDSGVAVWSARIDPYGRATVDPASVIDFAFRFPGHWFDAETGLHYNRFRYYDPALGRYLQSDPIGLAGGLNLYGYSDGNPLVRVDVRGTCPEKVGDGKGEGEDGTHPPHEGTAPHEDPSEMAVTRREAEEMAREAIQKQREDLAGKIGRGEINPDTGRPWSNADAGPVLAATVDRRTGEVFDGNNQRDHSTPETVPPVMQGPLADAQANPQHGSVPGEHAEVHSTADAIAKREADTNRPVTPAERDEFTQVSEWRRDGGENSRMRAGEDAPRCGNCQGITDGVDNRSGDAPRQPPPPAGGSPPPAPPVPSTPTE